MSSSLHTYRAQSLAGLMILSLLGTSMPLHVLKAQTSTPEGVGTLPPPVRTPKNVKINKTVPAVDPVSPQGDLSQNPSIGEISSLRIFNEPLIPTREPLPEENAVLATAVKSWIDRNSQDDFSSFEDYLAIHGDSAWAQAIRVNLAHAYYKSGWFGKSEAMWNSAWQLGKSDISENGKKLADIALAGLLGINARVGRFERLQEILAEAGNRPVEGTAGEWISKAKGGLDEMIKRPGRAFTCGPAALGAIQAARQVDPSTYLTQVLEARSPQEGFNLHEVWQLSEKLGMNLQMAYREPGSELILPCVINWKIEHYGALTSVDAGKYHLEDSTFVDDFWISQQAIDHESSGYFLVPAGPLPTGWRVVQPSEGEKVWGKGLTADSDPDATGCDDESTCPPNPSGGTGNSSPGAAMAFFSIQLLLVSLSIFDAPVGYRPPVGPTPQFVATYIQREAAQSGTFTHGNLGLNWTYDWLSYVTYNPNNASADVKLYSRGGGGETYKGFNSSNNLSDQSRSSITRLLRSGSTGAVTFERLLSDGAKEVYSQDDGVVITGGTTQKRAFLKEIVDPQGNTLTFTYDSSLRIIAATDAIGQVTMVEYSDVSNPLRITKVTDPFGRFATFSYDSQGRLQKITDIIGIESKFEYEGTFIKSMSTPYGTTQFASGEGGSYRWLEVTHPNGDKERAEYWPEQVAIGSDAILPSGLGSVADANNYQRFRNTFYWDRKAYKEGAGDYSKAKIFHWAHKSDAISRTSRNLESVKDPYSSRIFLQYTGASQVHFDGSTNQPSKIARVVDGPVTGTETQLMQFTYNSKGKTTQSIDPLGRVTNFVFDTNDFDLIEVNQQVASGTEKLLSATYNSVHRPVTVTDAAGQTTTYTYNTRGQVLTRTNAKSEVTSYTYDSDGYLITIDGPLGGTGDALTFTYDAYGRIATATDGEGYAIEMDYDVMDRPTLITYPDASTEQMVYDRLDLVASKDRAGKVTRMRYDSLGQKVGVRDPLGQWVLYDYCKCGAVKSITDGEGHITRWTHDAEGRVTSKIYADSTQEVYGYDLSSRLRTVTDALGQVKTYSYNPDDTLATVRYTNEIHSTPDVAYTYDAYYNRLSAMVDGSGTTAYGYHAISLTPAAGAGRLASVDGPLADDTISYDYDELGRAVERAINGAANERSIVYDAGGRVTSITNLLGIFSMAYVGSTERLATITAPNGLVSAFDYFPNAQDRRLKTLTHTGPDNAAISEFEYAYDVTGQIAQWTQAQAANTSHPELIWDLEQDAAEQLIGVTVRDGSTVTRRETNVYDRAGNRISAQINTAVKSGTFNNVNQLISQAGGGKHRFSGSTDEPANVQVQGKSATMLTPTLFTALAEVTEGSNNIPIIATDGNGNSRTNNYALTVPATESRTFTYDGNGNLLDDDEREYEWDAENRLIKITQGGDVYEFAYDGYGRRISETLNTTLERQWIWDGLTMAEERDADNAVTRRFFSQGEQVVGASSPNEKLYYTRDHLGSIREVTDTEGEVVSSLSYSAWGKWIVLSGSILPSFGYTGHWFHSATELVAAPFRFYNPDTARWLSRDPISETGGINLYEYVGNNSINYVDPTGEFAMVFPVLALVISVVAMAWLLTPPGQQMCENFGDAVMEYGRRGGGNNGERGIQGSNPNPNKPKTRHNQTGKKLPPKPTPTPPKPEPEIIPKGGKKSKSETSEA